MRHFGWTWLLKLAIVATTLVLAWRLLQEIGWTELLLRLESAQPGLLILAGLGLIARGGLLGLRWSQCLSLLDRSFSQAFVLTAHLAAILVNHLTPTARLLGGVIRARYLSRRYPVPFADALGTVVLDQASHQVVQGLLTWLAIVGLAAAVGATRIAMTLLAVLLVLTIALLIWRRNHRSQMDSPLVQWVQGAIEKRARRFDSLADHIVRIAEISSQGLKDPRLQLRLGLLGLAVVAVSAGSQWLVFGSLGYTVGYLQVIVVFTVGTAAGVVTGTPGGVATTEAAMIASYVALGLPELEATAATLLYRGLHYSVVLALGVPALVYCEMGGETKP